MKLKLKDGIDEVGIGGQVWTSADGAFEVSPEEAARLLAHGEFEKAPAPAEKKEKEKK